MPPQPPTTFRIEDLKARLKLEPKSRLFYPLAEELRKLDRFEDAEKVLRDGLTIHVGYVSAWISLGRVLVEQNKNLEAVDVLQKACTLDRGNVVAARLLAGAYLALGERVEAIKKYKLVRALLPADEEVEAVIERLDTEIRQAPAPAQPAPQAAAPAEKEAAAEPAAPPEEPPAPTERAAGTEPLRASEYAAEIVPPRAEVIGAAAMEQPSLGEPSMPFEPPGEPVPPQALFPEEPFPSAAEPITSLSPSEIFDQTHPLPALSPSEDPLATATMADLYAQQGHPEAAREIYGKVLEREPENEQVRERLLELSGAAPPAAEDGKRKQLVSRLEGWLSRVARK